MITELSPEVPHAVAHRLATILQAIEDQMESFAALRTQHNDRIKQLENMARNLRHEILTGQTSLIDAMEVGHSEPMSQGNQNR